MIKMLMKDQRQKLDLMQNKKRVLVNMKEWKKYEKLKKNMKSKKQINNNKLLTMITIKLNNTYK